MPANNPEAYAQQPPQGAPPQGGPEQSIAPGQAASPTGDAMPPAEAQNGEALLEPIQQMSDMIVQMAGPEALAQILQQGLDQLLNSAADGAQQGPPVEAAATPAPGGEAFGAMDR